MSILKGLTMITDHSDSKRRNCCHVMGYTLRLTAKDLLYALSDRQNITYHGPCYTSCGALAEKRNSLMDNHGGMIL